MKESLREYAEKVYHMLIEHGYNLDIAEIVFVGGGAKVMKSFGSRKESNIQYIEDVKANAKGNIVYHNLRMNLDNEQHRRIHQVLAKLNTEIHNCFIMNTTGN